MHAAYCNVLEYKLESHCNTLQHQRLSSHGHVPPPCTTDCNTMQHNAKHCNTLQRTANHGNTYGSHHTATHCNTILDLVVCTDSTMRPGFSSATVRSASSSACFIEPNVLASCMDAVMFACFSLQSDVCVPLACVSRGILPELEHY